MTSQLGFEPPTGESSAAAWRRHPQRSNAFDASILGADRRAWHPLTLSPGLLEEEHGEPAPVIGHALVPGLRAPSVLARLQTGEARMRFADATARRYLSDVLHGERAALRYAARMCLEAGDLGAQENAANQAREEARHVSAFSFYIQRRWGEPTPPTSVFGALLDEIERTDALRRIVGMQVLVEGLAMGVFGALQEHIADPLAREIINLVVADEAAHLRTGTACLQQAIVDAPGEQVQAMRAWTARQFSTLVRGLFVPTQQADLFAEFGLDPNLAETELRESGEDEPSRRTFHAVFRTLGLAILRAGLVDRSTRRIYAPFIA